MSGRRTAWQLRVEVDEPDAVVVTLVRSMASGWGGVAGFASAGPARPDGAAPTTCPWELYSIGVEDDLRGEGAADALLERAVGDRACAVWVLGDNARALAFYSRHGFSPEGSMRLHAGSLRPEVRLERARRVP